MAVSENGSSFEYVEDTQPIKSTDVPPSTLQKLLLDAQKDTSSRISSNTGSPKFENGNLSPALSSGTSNPQDQPEVEWVWDWSSRPELHPKLSQVKYKHPKSSRRRKLLSIRNTSLMRNISTLMDAFPYVIITHAFSFLAGAALVSFYMKKLSIETSH